MSLWLSVCTRLSMSAYCGYCGYHGCCGCHGHGGGGCCHSCGGGGGLFGVVVQLVAFFLVSDISA